ncbi:tRNA glutamyl-Q(34) synthetase GluQRS [Asticcacaulis machinosus]|uniref:tRNA glutamyl-Q(34) synthetase GluQRS n=1 Tax=Asticcacaulis machinosus TaxID=2984211 RepID=A0ABT5HPU3_9CAUL|nr:tRNA glutamyl-Q(34) synthetase GluQRS [Asticcacaulis machinosus]MDC7677664.1 tRNA glutamyl-Q(34) synthetase GluQRS [Asticcacaulis machinosus]
MHYITRFAPSPTGYLHPGHAFSALNAYDAAKFHTGTFILRIEDIDHTRCRSEYEQAIYDDLRWLGIDWPEPVLRQSEHMADYQAALERLKGMGLVYPCYKTRKELMLEALSAPQDTPVLPPADTPLDREPAWRLAVTEARDYLGSRWDELGFEEQGHGPKGEHGWQIADPFINGDVVLARKDVGIAYHLAVVVDDARQGITHIHRGHDLLEATHTQVLLQALLGLPTPQYHHHALLLDDTGQRLAKRKGSKSIRDLRSGGMSPADIKALIVGTAKA